MGKGSRKPRSTGGGKNDEWQRRQALQLAAQLPDGQDNQLGILRHLEWLVRNFMLPGGEKASKA